MEGIADSCISDGDDFAHDGGECEALGFSGLEEVSIEVCEGVFAAGSGESSDEEGWSELSASAGALAIGVGFAAVLGVGSASGEARGFVAVDGAEFGHGCDEQGS